MQRFVRGVPMRLRAIEHHNSFRRGISHALSCGILALCLLVALGSVHSGPGKKAISYEDLPIALCSWLEQQNIGRENFRARIAEINQKTSEREIWGEYDHLIFFLLQSSRFTSQPRIEPALSAYEFVRGLSAADASRFLTDESRDLPAAGKIPGAVNVRIRDFIKAISRERQDERMAYFAALLRQNANPAIPLAQRLQSEYVRAMKFLYRKEFASRAVKPSELAAHVASLYQERGHSTDTQIEANFAVQTALAALKAQSPETRLSRILIVGPGMDFAPRTDLIDLFGPQSYQPFAVADALLGLKLTAESQLQIHCVDINDRVIAHLQNFKRRKEVSLSLLSGVKESDARSLAEDYKTYFREFGRSIGFETALEVPSKFSGHLKKTLLVRPAIVKAISADRLNIVTERYQDSPQYDLVIVTNVFPYFSAPELLFALTNIAAMMSDGGYLIHNELQTVSADFIAPLGLPLQQARTVMITSGDKAPLFDGVAIHRKRRT